MSERAALLRGVIDAPDDDARRLVFADWCEDSGDPHRAEYIRVQCQIARTPHDDHGRLAALARREQQLWEAHGPAWRCELPKWARGDVVFRRGFASAVRCTPRNWLQGRGLVRQAPIQALDLRKHDPGRLAELAACAHFAGVRVLRVELSYQHTERAAELGTLFESPHLAGLRVLDVARGGYTMGRTEGDAVADALASLPGLGGLTALRLSCGEIGPDGAAALASSPHLGRLEGLDLRANPIGDRGAAALAASPNLPRLRALDLQDTALGDAGAEALAGSPRLAGLRHLNLDGTRLTAAGAAALAESPHLRDLEVLSLKFCPLGADGARALAGSPNLANLRYLNLFRSWIEGAGARALAESPHLKRLRVLDLGNNNLSHDDIQSLAHSGALPSLEVLSLYMTADQALADALNSSPGLPRLRDVRFWVLTLAGVAEREAEEPFGALHGWILQQRLP